MSNSDIRSARRFFPVTQTIFALPDFSALAAAAYRRSDFLAPCANIIEWLI
jgi:hypothetical protein